MKKLAFIIAAALALCFAGCASDPADVGGAKDISEEEPTLNAVNIIYSPHTGSESGNGSLESPLETREQADELAAKIEISDGQEIVILEYLMTVDVTLQGSAGVSSEKGGINMLPFTGSADSYYFKGTMPVQGCDTQKYAPDGSVMFSARYMLSGTDFEGSRCSIFIENNGPALDKCTLTIITDSAALSEWQDWNLRAIVVPCDGGVKVNILRVD